jgi:hypothetical protein
VLAPSGVPRLSRLPSVGVVALSFAGGLAIVWALAAPRMPRSLQLTGYSGYLAEWSVAALQRPLLAMKQVAASTAPDPGTYGMSPLPWSRYLALNFAAAGLWAWQLLGPAMP